MSFETLLTRDIHRHFVNEFPLRPWNVKRRQALRSSMPPTAGETEEMFRSLYQDSGLSEESSTAEKVGYVADKVVRRGFGQVVFEGSITTTDPVDVRLPGIDVGARYESGQAFIERTAGLYTAQFVAVASRLGRLSDQHHAEVVSGLRPLLQGLVDEGVLTQAGVPGQLPPGQSEDPTKGAVDRLMS